MLIKEYIAQHFKKSKHVFCNLIFLILVTSPVWNSNETLRCPHRDETKWHAPFLSSVYHILKHFLYIKAIKALIS